MMRRKKPPSSSCAGGGKKKGRGSTSVGGRDEEGSEGGTMREKGSLSEFLSRREKVSSVDLIKGVEKGHSLGGREGGGGDFLYRPGGEKGTRRISAIPEEEGEKVCHSVGS